MNVPNGLRSELAKEGPDIEIPATGANSEFSEQDD